MWVSTKTIAFIIFVFFNSYSYAGEMQERLAIGKHVRTLFVKEDFKALDELAETYRENEERTDSGVWKLTIFYYGMGGLANIDKDDEYWDNLFQKVEKWINQDPKKPTANLIKAIFLKAYAWRYRGLGYASQVPLDKWKPFKKQLRATKKHLLLCKKFAKQDPHWFSLMANTLKGLSVDKNTYLSLVDEGLVLHPYYYRLYFDAVEYLTPKWHGNKNLLEEFATQAAIRTQEKEKMGVYARIYWFASQTYYGSKLFKKSDVSWNKMKQGIIDVLEQYPDQWNIQSFAYFACKANDKDMTKKLLDKMSGPSIKRAWRGRKNYSKCHRFAYSRKPLK